MDSNNVDPAADTGPTGASQNLSHDAPKGTLIAIGGAEDKTSNLEVLTRVFAYAPADNKTVAVIATASQIPEEVLPAYEQVFKRLGATHVHSLDVQDRKAAKDPKTCEAVQSAGVIFFTGGDQMRLTHVLGGSPLLQAVRARYQEGAVVAGTSAGAVALSSTMIYNGHAADALRKGAVKMSNGLGFVDDVVIDSHFLERGRFTRLMEVGATNPEYLGFGLGEDAGVIFHNGGFVEAIGPGHVVIVDSHDMGSSNVADLEDGQPVAVENVVMHALIAGHGYDRTTRTYLGTDTLAQRLRERTPV
ncbi:cyanophycinase [Rhodovibrio salinarum]|uniref:Cyanophycinase n=1 Tax=Rhodovibrio salinarum TaxID=1087 RepID=A0A934QJZ5_9PROT|nr:cyanophycinase [Rhodovibrio salinarum]MBK1698072.1 cyanophycinase [Rhodovibrio salinarum]